MWLHFHCCTLRLMHNKLILELKKLLWLFVFGDLKKDIGPLPRYCTASVHLLHDSSLTSAEKLSFSRFVAADRG